MNQRNNKNGRKNPNSRKGSSQNKGITKRYGRDIKEIEIPGYIIEATLDLPRYHPHTIWWLAYITQLLEGNSLNELMENPPWPIPKDSIIISQLIEEMIDYQWLIPNWKTGNIDIRSKIKDIYDESGQIGLARYYLQYETIKGQWWIDGLEGTPMDIRTAQSFDLDFSKIQRREPHRINPEISPEEILEQTNFDLYLLTRMLQIPKKDYEELLPRAFLSSPFRITGQKDIRFVMYGDSHKKSQRILPRKLSALEPMLWSNAPEIFGKKKRRKKRFFRWHRSPVEKFALTLEKFPDQLSLLSSGQYYRYLGQTLLDELKKRDEWVDWYKNGFELYPIAGYAPQFFDGLADICEGKTDLDLYDVESSSGEIKSPELVLICSSFLNIKNLEKNDGLVYALRNCSSNGKILMLYGHANDDLPKQQKSDIDDYCSKLYSLEPSLKNKVLMIATKKRSHEKVILSSKGHWMICSWNPCSSYPNSTMFEAGVMGKSYQFALEILEKIKEIIEDETASALVRKLEDYYRNGIATEKSFNPAYEKELYGKISTATTFFTKLLINSTASQADYENALRIIRLAMVPYLKKSRVTLIDEYLSREVLISQIHFTRQDIVLASDRITKGALDRTIIQDILHSGLEGKRYLRILWGREWEEENHIAPAARLQIKEARRAIKDAMQFLGRQIKTSLNPMENHAKLAFFDGCRGLITSENILSYGGEKNKYESQELGVFIQSLPIIRFIEGKTIYHRLQSLEGDQSESEMAYRPYEWIVAITDQYFAFDSNTEDIGYDFTKLRYLESALELHHTKSDPYETYKFNRKLLKSRWECYKEREKRLAGSLFLQLWQKGIKYYLLLASSQEKWCPYSLDLDPRELENLPLSKTYEKDLESLNLLDYQKESILKVEPQVADSTPISTPLEAQINDSQSSEIHPIFEEIMKDMVEIPAGSFQMGDPKIREERPVHKVTITQPFYMGKYMVTQELWKKVMSDLPAMDTKMKSPNYPITYVNYYDIMDFIEKLNSLPSGGGFDLPTDAQWEYVCRAGTTKAYYFGNDQNKLNSYAWSKLNAKGRLHDVGLKKPNAWGLYDMLGLEFELVKDGYRKYTSNPVEDPFKPSDEKGNVCRGGHWGRYPFPRNLRINFFRCGVRYYPVPKDDISYRLSFRLVRKINDNKTKKNKK